jgi:hypothetical protein
LKDLLLELRELPAEGAARSRLLDRIAGELRRQSAERQNAPGAGTDGPGPESAAAGDGSTTTG